MFQINNGIVNQQCYLIEHRFTSARYYIPANKWSQSFQLTPGFCKIVMYDNNNLATAIANYAIGKKYVKN